ncbi:MAG: ribulose-phosphate 3-epimerase [Chloroflexi bacterium]|nr:ribulose-phosphate 3-epimerase [Chloroflexota bacterium]
MQTPVRKISPSLMCADLLNLKKDLDLFIDNDIEYFHIDIMDGHYVHNFSLGFAFCQAISSYTETPQDIHLMIDNPEDFVPLFAQIKSSIITFHPEVVYHPLRTIALIKRHGARAGIALTPAQTIESLRPLLPHVDLLCVMTVVPGFVSQSIIPGGIEKLRETVDYIRSNSYELEIEVDGNVSWENLPKMRDAGAQVFVAGTSSIFESGGDVQSNIRRFRSILEGGE